MRAKTIKNQARVNAELSAAELKAMVKKAQKDVAKYASFVGLLEGELQTWRQGGKVLQSDWASIDKAAIEDAPRAPAAASGTPQSKSPTPTSRPFTPSNPALEGLKEGAISRPDTPTGGAIDKDEREEFLRRENELTDQLGEKVRQRL